MGLRRAAIAFFFCTPYLVNLGMRLLFTVLLFLIVYSGCVLVFLVSEVVDRRVQIGNFVFVVNGGFGLVLKRDRHLALLNQSSADLGDCKVSGKKWRAKAVFVLFQLPIP